MRQEELTYSVEFLIKKTVIVKALDELYAEKEAARLLTHKQRQAVEQVRVLYADGTPMHREFYTPDKGWWE